MADDNTTPIPQAEPDDAQALPQNDAAKKFANAAAPLIPDDIKKPVQKFAQKLTDATKGADDAAVNLDTMLDKGLGQVEKKLNNFLDGLDNFLGKL